MQNVLLFLIFYLKITSFFTTAINNKDPGYKVYPLIMVKTNKGLEPPDTVIPPTTGILSKRMRFQRSTYKDEKFYCTARALQTPQDLEEIEDPTNEKDQTVGGSCLGSKSSSDYGDIPRCSVEPEPGIWAKNTGNSEDPTKIYNFGYKICVNPGTRNKLRNILNQFQTPPPPTQTIDFGIYQIMYDSKTKEIICTRHTIMSQTLLFNAELEKERNTEYENSFDGYGIFGEDFVNRKNIYKEIEKTSPFRIQKLVPEDDLVFALWRKPTYHYINISLMHEMMQPCWNKISEKIRIKARWTTEKVVIYTGAFQLPTDSHEVPADLTSSTHIPHIWVKIVHQTLQQVDREPFEIRSAIAIIANNHMNDEITDFLLNENYCEQNLCETSERTFVYCCKVTNSVLQLFRIKLEFDKILEIHDFIEVPRFEAVPHYPAARKVIEVN